MIVDANLLLFAVDAENPHQVRAARWLEDALNGSERVGLPLQTLGAFFRIATHPRVFDQPLSAARAHDYIAGWLAVDQVWVPPATRRTAEILGELVVRQGVTGNLVTDAQLAASAIEHGVAVASADTDFARFPEVRWVNPLAR